MELLEALFDMIVEAVLEIWPRKNKKKGKDEDE